MAKITNPEALEAQAAIRQHVAMTIATLKAVDMATRRDYRRSMKSLAFEVTEQAVALETLIREFMEMSNKERA